MLPIFPIMPDPDDGNDFAVELVPHVVVGYVEMPDFAAPVAIQEFAKARMIQQLVRRVDEHLSDPRGGVWVVRQEKGVEPPDIVRGFSAPSDFHRGRGLGLSVRRLAAQAFMSSWLTVRPASMSASPSRTI